MTGHCIDEKGRIATEQGVYGMITEDVHKHLRGAVYQRSTFLVPATGDHRATILCQRILLIV